MIIDTVTKEGIPYKCSKCGALFVWKPDEKPKGKCYLYNEKHECDETNCVFYEPTDDTDRCPICGSKYNHRISAMKYKFLRAFRRLWK